MFTSKIELEFLNFENFILDILFKNHIPLYLLIMHYN